MNFTVQIYFFRNLKNIITTALLSETSIIFWHWKNLKFDCYFGDVENLNVAFFWNYWCNLQFLKKQRTFFWSFETIFSGMVKLADYVFGKKKPCYQKINQILVDINDIAIYVKYFSIANLIFLVKTKSIFFFSTISFFFKLNPKNWQHFQINFVKLSSNLRRYQFVIKNF